MQSNQGGRCPFAGSIRLISRAEHGDVLFMALSLTLKCLDFPANYLCIPKPSEKDLPESILRIVQSETPQLCRALPDLLRARVTTYSMEMFDAGDVLFIEDSHYWTKDHLPESPTPPQRICNIAEYIDEEPKCPRQQRKLGRWPHTVAPVTAISDVGGNVYDKCVLIHCIFRIQAHLLILASGMHMVETAYACLGTDRGLTGVSNSPNHFHPHNAKFLPRHKQASIRLCKVAGAIWTNTSSTR